MPQIVHAAPLEDSFLKWWHEHYFYSNPLFKIYEELDSKGVDLNFLEFVRNVLCFMDRGGMDRASELKANKPNGKVAQFDRTLGPLTRLLRERPSYLGLEEKLPWDKPGLKYGDRLRIKSSHRTELHKSSLNAFKTEMSPFNHLILNYFFEAALYVTGGRPDRRGDLILTTLVEQFRRTIHKPLWYHAGQLLQAFRSVNGITRGGRKTKPTPYLLRKRTEARVGKFKRFNPLWRGEARLIIEHYRGLH